MPQYNVWSAETYNGHKPNGDESTMRQVLADYDWEAAELFAEQVHSDWECPSSLELFVAELSPTEPAPPLKKFRITVDYEPMFDAREVDLPS